MKREGCTICLGRPACSPAWSSGVALAVLEAGSKGHFRRRMIAKKPEPYSLADTVRDIYDAFSRRDMAELQRTGSSEIVLHVPGKSSLAGTHRGIGEVIAVAARAATR